MKITELDTNKIYEDTLSLFLGENKFNGEIVYHKYFKNRDVKIALFNSFKKEYNKELQKIFEAIEDSHWFTINNFSISKEYALHHFYLKRSRPYYYNDSMENMSSKFKINIQELLDNNILTEEEVNIVTNKEFEEIYDSLCTNTNFSINHENFYDDVKQHLDHSYISSQILDCNFEFIKEQADQVKSKMDEEIYELYYAFFVALSTSIGNNIPEDIKELAELNVAF